MTTPSCNSPGFSEAVVSVSDLAYWTAFLTDVFQWQLSYSGAVDGDILSLWNLPAEVTADEALFHEPGANTSLGAIRLVKFHGAKQTHARPASYAWDTGGFFDLHVQVNDVHALYQDMQQQGWQGFTEPKRLDVSGVVIDEVLVRGPDGMAFALIERVSPPFQVVDGYARVSPAWNAPQMVADFTAAHQFYSEGLGFKPTIEAEMPPTTDGDNLFALPLSIGKTTTTQLAFFHPTGQRGAIGSVDILKLQGLTGRALGHNTKPPNLGLLLLRFPVIGLSAYAAEVKAAGVELLGGLTSATLQPQGPCTVFRVQSPEGALLEFYESQSA